VLKDKQPLGHKSCALPPAQHAVIIYFAYGSNMLTERITGRAKDAKKLGVAHITGRRLTFHKIGTRRNGSTTGKCDICIDADPKAIVYGVLYQIPKAQFDDLNTYEKGYSSIKLVVHSPELGVVSAVAHVADRTDATLIPYDWYHGLVLEGAREHKLPDYYIREHVQNVPVEDTTGSTYKDAKEAKALLQRLRDTRTAGCNL